MAAHSAGSSVPVPSRYSLSYPKASFASTVHGIIIIGAFAALGIVVAAYGFMEART